MANLFDFTTPKASGTPFQLGNTFSTISPSSIQKASELPKNTAFDDYMQASFVSKEGKRKLLSDLQSGKITQEQADKIAEGVLKTPDTRLNTAESIGEGVIGAFRTGEQVPRYIGNIGKVLSEGYQLPYKASKSLLGEESGLTSFLKPGAESFKEAGEEGKRLGEEITMAGMTDGGTNKLTPEQISARKTGADIISTSILPAGNIANIGKGATLAQMIKSGAKVGAVTTPQFYAMTEGRLPTAGEMVAGTAGGAIITPAIGKAIKYGTALTKGGISGAGKSISRDVSSIGIPGKETATRAIPTKIVGGQLGFTPTERAKIEKIVGTDEATYLLNKGLAGQSKEQLAEHFMKQSDEMYNGITQKLAKVDKRVESNSAKEALQDILDQLESKPKFQRAYAKDIAAAKKMIESGEYSLSDLNNIRRAYDKVNTGMYTAQGAARSGIENEIDIRVRNELSEQIQKEAKLAGVDVKEMNKELRAGLVMKDAILRRLSQEQRNNFIGLQDLGVSAILSGGNPATAAATILTKKYIESIAPTVAQKLYNLNKAPYVPRTVTRGNTISPRNKSSILNLAGSTVTPVASKQVNAAKTPTTTKLLPAPKLPKGTTPGKVNLDQKIIDESKKELKKGIISNKTTNAKSKVMNDGTNSKSDVVPEGYFKNVFGEIVKNPRNKNKGSLNIGQIAKDLGIKKIPDAKTIELYHGTDKVFNKFLKDKIGTGAGLGYGKGVYLTDKEFWAKNYAEQAKLKNSSDIRNIITAQVENKTFDSENILPNDVVDSFNKITDKKIHNGMTYQDARNELIGRDYKNEQLTAGRLDKLNKLLEDKGFNGIKFGDSYNIFNPDNVKILRNNVYNLLGPSLGGLLIYQMIGDKKK